MTKIISNTHVAGALEHYATSTTTPPRDTFHEVTLTPGDGVLMYWPEKNGFLALFADEYRAIFAEGRGEGERRSTRARRSRNKRRVSN